MLNAVLKEMVELGMVDGLSQQQRERLIKKLWNVCWNYDCNWGEIIDARLARQLGVCRSCGKLATELDEEGSCSYSKGR